MNWERESRTHLDLLTAVALAIAAFGLYWSAEQAMAEPMAMSVRLHNDQGLWQQQDSQPVHGLYSTVRWRAGEGVADQFLFVLSNEEEQQHAQAWIQLIVYNGQNLRPYSEQITGQEVIELGAVSLLN